MGVGRWLLAVTGLAPMPGPGAAVFIRAEARTADGCGHFDSFSGSERAKTRSLILDNITHTPQRTRLKRNARQLLLLLLLLFGSLDCPSWIQSFCGLIANYSNASQATFATAAAATVTVAVTTSLPPSLSVSLSLSIPQLPLVASQLCLKLTTATKAKARKICEMCKKFPASRFVVKWN